MTLMKEMLTKSLKKGRLQAVSLLNDLARIGRMPEPHYEYTPGGNVKKPWHFYKLKFRVPPFLRNNNDTNVIVGAGRCRSKKDAKSLAALEAVHRLEESLNAERGSLVKRLEEYKQQQLEKTTIMESTPITDEITGVSWCNVPVDVQFPQTLPADRRGRISFHPSLLNNPDALLAARAITLMSKHALPTVDIHANQTDSTADLQRWANIRAAGKIEGTVGPCGDASLGADDRQAELLAFERMALSLSRRKDPAVIELVRKLQENETSSFGMAKLFVSLPKHHFKQVKELVEQIDQETTSTRTVDPQHHYNKRPKQRKQRDNIRAVSSYMEDHNVLKRRVEIFRAHQKDLTLPIDSVETEIPHDAPVTIVRGGTGSGKTTRYPLMLSLFSPAVDSDTPTKILVVQPRRLACQAAAHRVAYEQGHEIGKKKCPVGYAIRFESFPSLAENRTIDFFTPGVLLRKATDDPLLSDITHLCIDEVHERNADMDLLLALAKQAQEQRENHEALPPLRLVLMSATLDCSQWESYFDGVEIVNVPDVRRFPIDVVHIGDAGFPNGKKALKQLKQQLRHPGGKVDDALCRATADLAVELFQKDNLDGGSILCFLPGIEEIRLVDNLIRSGFGKKKRPTIRYLHSSLSSSDQQKVFRPGPKIILSTNLAETSVTIPDVKIVIDSGRERQFSMLESTRDSERASVVGSQLVTVNISQSSAKQRAGRAGRVSAGTCYRLYTRGDFQSNFEAFTLPEMQRMELSQLVLHSVSLYHPASGHPLSLLLNAPDPPMELRLKQTLYGLSQQGLVNAGTDNDWKDISLTPLGKAVSDLPASPRIGRMLIMGLVLRAIDSALTIASLMSVPKTFSSSTVDSTGHCSDIVVQLLAYQKYLESGKDQTSHPMRSVFEQVSRVRRQLKHSIKTHLSKGSEEIDWDNWNANNHRVAAQAGLICGATPHIAHLVNGMTDFATRDIAGTAKIHPSSVNFRMDLRTHWYMYHELRTTKAPYLHVTTAASPLEVALFSDSTSRNWLDDDNEVDIDMVMDQRDPSSDEWLFIADQWVPIDVSANAQRETFLRLKRMLTFDMLQQAAQDPVAFCENEKYERLVLFVLSAIEQQRLSK